MKTTKPQPQRTDAPDSPRTRAFGDWMMQNIRREVRAGRLRTTIDENGVEHAIN
jgi:hypothetical protein